MSLTHTFSFPVSSFRHVESPPDLKLGIRDFFAFVKIRDLPDFTGWRKINVRDPKLKGSVPTAIRNGLKDNPALFMIMNRGIVISTDDTKYDNQSKLVTVQLTDPQLHGLLDGGHTYDIVRSEIPADVDAEKEPHVKIEFLVGCAKGDIEAIVDARNTSNQVQDEGLMNLAGSFDLLKQALKGSRFFNKIAFKEYELDEEGNPKPIDIREVLAILTAFDKDHFDEKQHPINSYRSKVAVLKHFKENQESYKKIYPLAVELLELYDHIQCQLPNLYNQERSQFSDVSGGRFGRLIGVSYDRNKPRYELQYLGKKTNYGVPTGFVYPILGAFRAMLEESDGVYRWGKGLKPLDFLAGDVGLSLAGTLGSFARDQQNPSKTGKFAPVWQSCYQNVELAYLRAK